MIRVKKLTKPGKKSGYALAPGETTEVRGLTIVNRNKFVVYVDKFTPQHLLRKRKN